MFENQGAIAGSNQAASSYYSSETYNEAVNAARFVKSFGVTSLIYAVVSLFGISFLSGGVGVGVGLFVLRYDNQTFYRVLGIAMIVLAIVGVILPVGPVVLAGAVLGKGIQALGVFSREGQQDEEWAPSRQRALIGTIASAVALVVSILSLVLASIGVIYAIYLAMKGQAIQ